MESKDDGDWKEHYRRGPLPSEFADNVMARLEPLDTASRRVEKPSPWPAVAGKIWRWSCLTAAAFVAYIRIAAICWPWIG